MATAGIVLYHGIESGPELSSYGRMAEQAGFGSLWVTERYFHEETFSMLGYLAATTEHIRLGVGVVNPFTRHPALLGMGAATLDRLSGGRMMLGLGRSDVDVIRGRMGMEYQTPLARLRGTVTALRSMWDGNSVSAQYAGVRLSNVGLAIRPIQERLPVYFAAIGPRALRLAGEVADGVLLNAYAPVDYIRWAADMVRRSAMDAGRDPEAIDIACMLIVRLTNDPDAMIPSLRERIARLVAEHHTGEVLLGRGGFDTSILDPIRRSIDAGDESGAGGYVSEELARSCYLLGDAAECRRRIREYLDAGVDTPLLLPRLEAFEQTCRELAPQVNMDAQD